MASMNTRLNIEKLDGILYKSMEGAQRDREAEVSHVSNDDAAVAQRWLEDKQLEEKTNTTLVNMGFNESGEYKKTFIGSGVGTGSMQVLQGDEFEVEPQDDHTFEGATLCMGTIQYREDSNETAFAVAAVGKIYAHESLTFNNTVACEVIFKWETGLKDDMDARSDVYVLSNGYDMVFSCVCKAEIWVTKGLLVKAKGNVLGLEIIRDQNGNTLRVSQSRIHNEKLVQTLLKGHSTLSLEDSLSMDHDVEKNGKRSYIYAVGSQEYQMVCTRPDIASADVDMLDRFCRGLPTNVQVFVDFDYAMERSITHMETLSTTEEGYMMFTEAWKKEIWLKGLLTESGYELNLVAGIATRALVKGGSRSEVPPMVEVAA
ncbi:hypothetical protein Tco_0453695 [Tanacetum coccineum]